MIGRSVRKCNLSECRKEFSPSQRGQRYCCRPHQKKGSMRAWQKKNRKKVRLYNNQWRLSNPEKVRAQKRRSALKYKARRLMLYKSRSPEWVAEDKKKAIERYRRWYPARTPELLERHRQRSRMNYKKLIAAVALGKAAARQRTPAKRGRKEKPEESREYFRIGRLVQEKLADGLELTAARRLVAKDEGRGYASVVRYHKEFRKVTTRDKISA